MLLAVLFLLAFVRFAPTQAGDEAAGEVHIPIRAVATAIERPPGAARFRNRQPRRRVNAPRGPCPA